MHRSGEPDPFAPAPESAPERTVTTLLGPLAHRDPDAALDDSAEYRVPDDDDTSFDELLRRARWQGFFAGAGAGVIAAAALAGAFFFLAPPAGRDAAAGGEAARAVVSVAAAADTGAAPPSVARPAPRAGRADATGQGTGIDLRAPQAAAAVPGPLTPALSPGGGEGDLAAHPDRLSRGDGGEGDLAAHSDGLSRGGGGEGDLAAHSDGLSRGGGGEGDHPAHSGPLSPRAAGGEGQGEGGRTVAAVDAPRATGATDPPTVRDGLDVDEVAAALRASHDALDGCFAAAEGDAAPPGGLRLLVSIDPSGRVADARVDDPEVQRSRLGVCLSRVARGMSFAPFEGEPIELALPLRVAERG